MVAYSFQPQFRGPILAGTKRGTIRSDRKRHARPGETVQLYTGMRTRQCSLIGRALCSSVLPVRLDFGPTVCGCVGASVEVAGIISSGDDALNEFAVGDGFADWAALDAFWRKHHPGVDVFDGVMISWGQLLCLT